MRKSWSVLSHFAWEQANSQTSRSTGHWKWEQKWLLASEGEVALLWTSAPNLALQVRLKNYF